MKIMLHYYSFYTVLLYFIITIIKMCASNDREDILKQFIKAMIIVPILVSMYFAKL